LVFLQGKLAVTAGARERMKFDPGATFSQVNVRSGKRIVRSGFEADTDGAGIDAFYCAVFEEFYGEA
jgi:hypothetical protein